MYRIETCIKKVVSNSLSLLLVLHLNSDIASPYSLRSPQHIIFPNKYNESSNILLIHITFRFVRWKQNLAQSDPISSNTLFPTIKIFFLVPQELLDRLFLSVDHEFLKSMVPTMSKSEVKIQARMVELSICQKRKSDIGINKQKTSASGWKLIFCLFIRKIREGRKVHKNVILLLYPILIPTGGVASSISAYVYFLLK